MDTSKWYEDPVYIKMSDCPEIQEQKPDMGLVPPTNEDVFIGKYGCFWAGDFDWIEQRSRYIWLPTQSQLQEMVLPNLKYQDTEHLLRALNEWNYSEVGYEPYSRFYSSMEQLWLAFVMKEKFNKVWTDGKWSANG